MVAGLVVILSLDDGGLVGSCAIGRARIGSTDGITAAARYGIRALSLEKGRLAVLCNGRVGCDERKQLVALLDKAGPASRGRRRFARLRVVQHAELRESSLSERGIDDDCCTTNPKCSQCTAVLMWYEQDQK